LRRTGDIEASEFDGDDLSAAGVEDE
jgi:hypothetical protein